MWPKVLMVREASSLVNDWAQDVAERIVGDIPHSIYVRWAADVPERVAAMLRLELNASHDGEHNAFIEEIVRALPDYLPELAAARMRAKLAGSLLTARALGQRLRKDEALTPDAVRPVR